MKVLKLLGSPPHDTLAEQWKELPGTGGGYYASSLGFAFSVPRRVERDDGTTMRIRGGLLKQNGKELNVSIPFEEGGTRSMTRMALILLAFDRAPRATEVAAVVDPSKPVALGNVRYQCSHNAILDEEKVREIIRLSPKGNARRDVADKFGISVITLGHILANRAWLRVPREDADASE